MSNIKYADIAPSKRVLLSLLSKYSVSEISKKYRISKSTIWLWKKRYHISTGRTGESHHSHKLTDHDVVLIRTLYKEGMMQSEIADKFEVTQSVISDIVNYVTWKHAGG